MPVKVGDVAQCDGMLTSPHVLRQALHCKTVEVPRLHADLDLCKANDATLLTPAPERPLVNARAWVVAVSFLTVGVIVGWALSPHVSLP